MFQKAHSSPLINGKLFPAQAFRQFTTDRCNASSRAPLSGNAVHAPAMRAKGWNAAQLKTERHYFDGVLIDLRRGQAEGVGLIGANVHFMY